LFVKLYHAQSEIFSSPFFCSEPSPVGEEIILTFSYPGHENPVKIVGEIVWNVPQGLAVKFKTADERLEAAIKALS